MKTTFQWSAADVHAELAKMAWEKLQDPGVPPRITTPELLRRHIAAMAKILEDSDDYALLWQRVREGESESSK